MINEELEYLIWRDFPGGLLLSTPAAFGQDAGQHGNRNDRTNPREFARQLKGVYTDRGNLRHIGSVTTFLNTTREPYYIHPFYALVETATDPDNEIRGYLVARPAAISGHEWVFIDPDEATTTTGLGSAWSTPNDNDAVVFKDRIIYTDSGGELSVMYRDKTSKSVGLAFGNFAGEFLTPSDGGAGPLDNTAYPEYFYLFVLVDEHGNRSNPSPVSPTGIRVTNKQVELEFSGTYIAGDIDDLSAIEIYRIGGRNSEFRLAKSFVPDLNGSNEIVDDATGNYVIDDTIDELLPDIFPAEGRDLSPHGIRCLAVHQDRIFGGGFPLSATYIDEWETPSRLWFSRKNEPEAWGYDDNGVDDDGGYLDIDRASDDPILCLESLGSILLIGRAKSLYALYGEGFNTFRPHRISDVGAASRRAFMRDGNTVYFFGNDRKLYRVGDAQNDYLLQPIETAFDAVTDEELRNCVCWCHDKRLYISIPTSGNNVVCYCYQIRNSSWVNLSYAEFRVNYATSLVPHDSTGSIEPFGIAPLLVLCRTGQTVTHKIVEGSSYNWSVDIQTLDYYPGDYEKARVLTAAIEGTLTNASNALTATLTAGGNTKAVNFGGAGSDYVAYYSRRLPPSLMGEFVRTRITGTLALGAIDRIALGLLRVRPTIARR